MTPKVCLVMREFGNFNRAWTQILRNLGIDYTLCTATAGSTSASIQTPPMRWFRVEIPEGHWDEYRIEVRSATPRLVYSRVIASQGYWKE